MRRVAVDGTELGVEVEGSGEPVLLIQTGLVADEFLPLAAEPVLRDHYRVIRYHRRGYGQSTPVQGAGSIQRDAADARALLAALGVEHRLGRLPGPGPGARLRPASPPRVGDIHG
jgi:3-oxoadipate enol-lactonase